MARLKLLLSFLMGLGFCVNVLVAQDIYGARQELMVPYVAPGTLTLDGNLDEAVWDDATVVNIQQIWDGDWGGHPVPDQANDARLLWTDDTLFVYAEAEDYEFFFGPDTAAWIGEQFLIAVDGPMAGDPATGPYAGDPAPWSGAPWNAPDLGPTTYKVFDQGITSNWGGYWHETEEQWYPVSPVDSGWVDGTVFVDSTNFVWGVEMKIYVPQIALGTSIGFNIGGAAATGDTTAIPWEWGEGTYAYYAWNGAFGGELMYSAANFGILTFVEGDIYGARQGLLVPYVEPGTLTLDGNLDESEWANATYVNVQQIWDGDWGGHPNPDHMNNAFLLWTEDTLFAYIEAEDYEFFFGPDTAAWIGEQFLIAVDGPMAGDPTTGPYAGDPAPWSGAPWNAPDLGPTTYKVFDQGITANWGGYWDEIEEQWYDVSPVDSGWVDGTVFVDSTNFKWGVEMKIYVSQIASDGRIGFNMGGAAATGDTTAIPWEWGEGTYAYYAWNGAFGGELMYSAANFGMLRFIGGAVAIDDTPDSPGLPKAFKLHQNYPNPFNPVTTISYSIPANRHVEIAISNILGQKVASLVNKSQDAGSHDVFWDASGLTSGVYFYSLIVDGKLATTKKTLLLK